MAGAEVNIEDLRMGGVVKLREADMFSIWVKTACCNLNSRQLRKIADITDRYGRGLLLFTSRQIPIIPHVNLKDVKDVQRELAGVDLELDRCGPRVRNINVCYDDKTCPDAVVNSIALAEKLESFFRNPMLHKVKIGVAGCGRDCIISRVLNDVSFVGAKNGERQGYHAYVGGRLGVNPFVGLKMAEYLSEEQAVRLLQNYFAMMERDSKKGERGADVIARFGESRVKLLLTGDLTLRDAAPVVTCVNKVNGHSGKTVLKIRATCGEVNSRQARAIADIADRYGQGVIHFDVYGGPEIPGVATETLPAARTVLEAAGLKTLDSGVANIQACFGSYCAEGLGDSQSLLRRVEQKANELGLNDLSFRISGAGCPNSCGIAHASDLGFHGVVDPEVNAAACEGCGLCPQVCKRKAIRMEKEKAVIDKAKCGFCGQCIDICPYNAIGESRRGFAVLAGGREGEDTQLGKVIGLFVNADEAFRLGEGVLKVAKKKGGRVAGVIDEVGLDNFKELVDGK